MTAYNDIILRDGPKLYLPLNDVSGATATALAGSNGTYVGSPTLGVAGPVPVGSTGIGLNGSSQWVTSAAELTISTDMTVEVWAKKDAGTGLYSILTVSTSGAAAPIGLDTYGVGGNNKFRAFMTANSGGTNYLEATDTDTITDGVWHHLVGVYTAADTTLRLYVDGVEVGSDSTTSGTRDMGSSKVAYVGRYNDSYSQYWPGALAATVVYDYALTAAQVAQHYAASPPALMDTFPEVQARSMGAVLHLPLDDKGGSTAFALVGSNGSYVGTPTFGAAGPSPVLPRAVDLTAASSQHVVIPDNNAWSVPTTGELSIEIWFKLDALSGAIDYLVAKDAGAGTYEWGCSVFSAGAVSVAVWQPSGAERWRVDSANGLVTAGTWNHYLVSVDDDVRLDLYLNGLRVGSKVGPNDPSNIATNTNSPVYVGRRGDLYEGYTDGKFAGLTIYNRALTAAEAYERYALGLNLRSAHANSPLRY